MPSVQPSVRSRSSQDAAWLYAVRPTQLPPTLDLSVTLKRRMLGARGEQLFDAVIMWQPRLLQIGYALSAVCYAVIPFVPAAVGRPLAIVATVIGLPGAVLAVSVLRYEVIKVLVRTVDILFFWTLGNVATVLLMFMFRDARATVVVQGLVAWQSCTFSDANVQGVRRFQMASCVVVLTVLAAGCSVHLDTIPELTDFTVVAYGDHKLRARDIVSNGLITVATVTARNVYRSRNVLLKLSSGSLIECASYRCLLALSQRNESAAGPSAVTVVPTGHVAARQSAPHIKTMRYFPQLRSIDARRTLVPGMLQLVLTRVPPSARRAWAVFGYSAAALTAATACFDYIRFKAYCRQCENDSIADSLREIALFSTALYTLGTALLYQRHLLRATCTAFDFVFLTAQVSFVLLAMMDLFRWPTTALTCVSLWLWCLWVFCIDALTPIVRSCLQLSRHFPLCVFTALLVTGVIAADLVVFDRISFTLFDRVLWSGQVFSGSVEFRVLPTFYSSLGTVLVWGLRVWWRLWSLPPDGLIMVDGPMVYENYLRAHKQPKGKRSRMGLLLPAMKGMTSRLLPLSIAAAGGSGSAGDHREENVQREDPSQCRFVRPRPGECVKPRKCQDCLVMRGCMVGQLGVCESVRLAGYDPALDYRNAINQGLSGPEFRNPAANETQLYQFPALNVTYCAETDAVCQRCRADVFPESPPDSRFCVGEYGCVCIAACESAAWVDIATGGECEPAPLSGEKKEKKPRGDGKNKEQSGFGWQEVLTQAVAPLATGTLAIIVLWKYFQARHQLQAVKQDRTGSRPHSPTFTDRSSQSHSGQDDSCRLVEAPDALPRFAGGAEIVGDSPSQNYVRLAPDASFETDVPLCAIPVVLVSSGKGAPESNVLEAIELRMVPPSAPGFEDAMDERQHRRSAD
ncbi:hypothetical protein ATCC90586_002150 [Pythium insidiosum]|nr:hypothetical protein ATCC90586_002150 [Pythium insidiosum]